jgi:hypothetical protein
VHFDIKLEGLLKWLILSLQQRLEKDIARGLFDVGNVDFEGFKVNIWMPGLGHLRGFVDGFRNWGHFAHLNIIK